MKKVNSHSKANVWENKKHSKALGFLHISCETLIHSIPKIWEKWVPIVREMGKIWKNTNISKLRVPKTWEKWILIVQEKCEKTQTFQIYGFIKYFGWSIHSYIYAFPKIWEKWIYLVREKYGKIRRFSISIFQTYCLLPRRFRVNFSLTCNFPCNFQCLEMYKFP